MPLTSDTVEELDRLLDIFFEKINRKGRIHGRLNKLLDKNYAYFRPKVDQWLKESRKQIISDLNKKYIRKAKTPVKIVADLTDWKVINENGKKIFKPAVLEIMARSGNEALKIAGVEAS